MRRRQRVWRSARHVSASTAAKVKDDTNLLGKLQRSARVLAAADQQELGEALRHLQLDLVPQNGQDEEGNSVV